MFFQILNIEYIFKNIYKNAFIQVIAILSYYLSKNIWWILWGYRFSKLVIENLDIFIYLS